MLKIKEFEIIKLVITSQTDYEYIVQIVIQTTTVKSLS